MQRNLSCSFCKQPIRQLPLFSPCSFHCVSDICCLIERQWNTQCIYGHHMESLVKEHQLFHESTKHIFLDYLHNTPNPKRECPICFVKMPMVMFIPVTNCRHTVCLPCAFHWIAQQITQSSPLICTIPNCAAVHSIHLLKNYQILSSWIENPFLLFSQKFSPITQHIVDSFENSLAFRCYSDSQRHFCPQCNGLSIMDSECTVIPKRLRCGYCFFDYCFECNKAWHDGNCQIRKLKNKLGSKQDFQAALDAKQCPRCGILTVHYKYHGCHHILPGGGCPNCGLNYCYACMTPNWPCKVRGCAVSCSSRCSCPLCPECNVERPCFHCDGCPKCDPQKFLPRRASLRSSNK